MKHLIGKPVQLIDSACRIFGGAEQGIVRRTFEFVQLAKTEKTWYIDIDWFDLGYSSFPVYKLEFLEMNAIWKFPVGIGKHTINVPQIHRFIHADFVTDAGRTDFAVWAEVDTHSQMTEIDIVIHPTGNGLSLSPMDYVHIGSFRTNHNNVPEFWHAYKVLPKRDPDNCCKVKN